MNLVGVLIQETEPEDTECLGVGLKLLNYQVVVLTGFYIGTVFTNTVGNQFEYIFPFFVFIL